MTPYLTSADIAFITELYRRKPDEALKLADQFNACREGREDE